MSQYGGGAKYGVTQWGPGPNRSEEVYRVLLGLLPPGAYDTSPEAINQQELRAWAQCIADHGQLHVERLRDELAPDLAAATLPEWEGLFGVVDVHAAQRERRAAVLARARVTTGDMSVPAMRRMLAPILNPRTAFADRFESPSLRVEWEASAPAGAVAVVGGQLVLSAISGEVARWGTGAASFPRALLRLPDRDDDWRVVCQVAAASLGLRTGVGLVAWQGADYALRCELYNEGGTLYVQAGKSVADQHELSAARVAVPGVPIWLSLRRLGPAVECGFAQSIIAPPIPEAGWTVVHTWEDPLVAATRVGVFARNRTPAFNAFQAAVELVAVSQKLPHNNVEILEIGADETPAGAPENVWFWFVHREPADGPDYDLAQAQDLVDRHKPAHSLGLVGESDCFLVGDPNSLLGRDVMGG